MSYLLPQLSTSAAQSSPRPLLVASIAGLLAVCLPAGCTTRSEREVVVYTALDSEFSEPILERYEAQSGVPTRPKFDVEANKTLGLTQEIIAEADRPRCDVFWNNEILNTLRLEQRGLLDAYQPKMAAAYPALFRSPHNTWHGFAARARVLLINTQALADSGRPESIYDLADEKWRGRCGLAKPLFGTTATHVACLFARLGDEKARQLLADIKANEAQVFPGNKQVAQAVSSGQIVFGLTDTDDAMGEIEQGHPVEIVYPDQQDDGLGTLFIPNTLAILKGAPHPEEARKLVDYLLTPDIEVELANGPSAQIPLSTKVEVELRVETPRTVRAMQVDFHEAAEQWDTAARAARDAFARAD